jgi:hypothetical protein
LGLSLVAAIARLHDLSLRILDGTPGCVFELSRDHPQSVSSNSHIMP